MAYKIIAFDFDGTLVDSRGVATSTVKSMARRFLGRSFSEEQIESWRERDLREVICEVGLPQILLPIFIWQFRRNYRRQAWRLEFFPGILELWQELAGSGREVGIITSNSKAAVLETFERHMQEDMQEDMQQDMQVGSQLKQLTGRRVFSQESFVVPKFIKGGIGMSGKRTALLDIINKYEIDRKELLYLGDEIRDVTSCIEVGVDIAAVSWGFNTKSALVKAKPTYILEKPEELRGLVGI